jgi:hypothetical protein
MPSAFVSLRDPNAFSTICPPMGMAAQKHVEIRMRCLSIDCMRYEYRNSL